MTSPQLAARFNEIGVEPTDLDADGWAKFFNDGWILKIQWKQTPAYTEKLIRLHRCGKVHTIYPMDAN